VYVDDECVLCSRTAQWIRRHDRRQQFRFGSVHALAPMNPQSVVVQDGAHTYTCSRAVVQILWRLGRWWKLLAVLLYAVPAVIRDRAYDIVARHRHQWFGPPQCSLPADEPQTHRHE